MDRERFQAWLDRYVDAWRANDADAVGALFADDAQYRYHPWDEPVVGREAIIASWLEEPDEPDSWDARYEPWAIAEDRAVATGVTRYSPAAGTPAREYHNVFLCRFDAGGRCVEFTEIFLKRPE